MAPVGDIESVGQFATPYVVAHEEGGKRTLIGPVESHILYIYVIHQEWIAISRRNPIPSHWETYDEADFIDPTPEQRVLLEQAWLAFLKEGGIKDGEQAESI